MNPYFRTKKIEAVAGPERGLLFGLEIGIDMDKGLLVDVEGRLVDEGSQLLASQSRIHRIYPIGGNLDEPCVVGKAFKKAAVDLHVPLSDRALATIERRRDRKQVAIKLAVRVRFHEIAMDPSNKLGVPRRSHEVYDAEWTPVPLSIWTELLKGMGWSEIELFEVPALPLRGDEKLQTALGRLREAEERLRLGDYRGVIAKCREAFESAAKFAASSDNVKTGFALLIDRAFKGDTTKQPLVDAVIASLSDYAHTVGRHDQYPSLSASRSEAEFAYATTVALFSMISRRLSGEETQ